MFPSHAVTSPHSGIQVSIILCEGGLLYALSPDTHGSFAYSTGLFSANLIITIRRCIMSKYAPEIKTIPPRHKLCLCLYTGIIICKCFFRRIVNVIKIRHPALSGGEISGKKIELNPHFLYKLFMHMLCLIFVIKCFPYPPGELFR